MWLNVDVSDMLEQEVIDFALFIKEKFNKPIILSINTNSEFDDVIYLIKRINYLIKAQEIDIIFGPHFVLEGLVDGDQLYYFDNLNIASKGERIIWGLKNIKFPVEIEKVGFLDKYLGIFPFSLKYKEKELDSKFDYYFWYECLDFTNMDTLIKNDNFHFKRIKGRGNSGNNYQY